MRYIDAYLTRDRSKHGKDYLLWLKERGTCGAVMAGDSWSGDGPCFAMDPGMWERAGGLHLNPGAGPVEVRVRIEAVEMEPNGGK